ncbi:phosphatidylinositol-specific phospholipase C domain-containing protein [Streptomyces sp. NBC_00091]|uniref:phosphatidylinositol-specific phospholipase C domain-containing protein n=1 Tax=Streptomyces sp. NBC_00091 TaxID=2975648 RepID=UPI0022584B21|nr:phosphatidylinositol-specific phospholipase C domain-containing protein [Streptomyces sp. NBC_00091]MCX5375112.1 Ca2+-dependent phosphoinositide-specific phospholipase C [Streptomyces sp. NBC_00091]
MTIRTRTAGASLTLLTALTLTLPTTPAAAADLPYISSTGVGVHNAYEKAKYPYFADALDSGAAMLELDVWTNFFGSGWRVSHDNPFGNDSNCENATTPAQLRTKSRNQNLAGCLSDIRSWHDAHPGHRPIVLKLELKDGFAANLGRGPAELDTLLNSKLGDALYRPGQLAAGHPDLDTAARAGAWPSRSAMAGKFLVELIPGTLEEGNSSDKLWTDREYAEHLRTHLPTAAAFPAVHRAEPGDPRNRYADPSLRPWFVVFDGDSTAYTSGSIDTTWYHRNHYLLIATDAHNVTPAIDPVHPTESEARARVALMATHHASITSSDWYPLPSVLATVLPRG